jgi:hypothetical protein
MEFVNMEQIMLTALKWRVNGPTALQFAQHYISFLPDTICESVNEAIFNYTRFQIELATADQSFVAMKMSEYSLAAVLNAMEGIDTSLLPIKIQGKFIRNIAYYCQVSLDNVKLIQAKMSLLLVTMLASEFGDIIVPMIDAADEHARDFEVSDGEGNPEYVVKNGRVLKRYTNPATGSLLKT